ncbi:MAG: hypothetical protein KME16_00405 [Scytolyngbya sp. HA4215-MV1]|jgi:hypothetical protein|nr:hypothetical protein [Scytolyngbya sp. HA4215-MV1]
MQLLDSTWNDRQDWVCVIDPALALSQYGVTLIKQLGNAMEVWIGRELWHILENAALYIQQPELIAPRGLHATITFQQERKALEETIWALREWEVFRLGTDLAGLNIFWIGDSRRESFIPKDRSLEILDRWELVASVLDSQFNQMNCKDYILPLAFRDAIALAASLENAFILTRQIPRETDENAPPEICSVFETWEIPCQYLTTDDSMVAIKSNHLHQLLIRTNTAKVVWSGVHLAALHLLAPTTLSLQKLSEQTQSASLLNFQKSIDRAELYKSLLARVRGFWHLI